MQKCFSHGHTKTSSGVFQLVTTQELQSSAELAGQQHGTCPSSKQWCTLLLLHLQVTRALLASPGAELVPCILGDCRHRLRAWILRNSRRFNEVKLSHIHSSGYYTHLQPFCFPNLFPSSSSYTIRIKTLRTFPLCSYGELSATKLVLYIYYSPAASPICIWAKQDAQT